MKHARHEIAAQRLGGGNVDGQLTIGLRPAAGEAASLLERPVTQQGNQFCGFDPLFDVLEVEQALAGMVSAQ